MVFQPTIIVNQTGSSGIPAYDSLEEITSPSAGMVVKINGQEGGSGTPRGVLADDVLGVVAWATTPDNLTFVENTWTTLLTFSDGKKIETYREYVVDITDYANAVVFDNRTIYLTTDFGDYPEWNNATYDFGNRTVSAINDSSIQSVIIVTPSAPAIPDKYYIYKDSAWVELVDVTLTTPSIDIVGTRLDITDNANGIFAQGYKIYADAVLAHTTSSKSVDLATYVDAEVGATITVQAYGENFTDSVASTGATYPDYTSFIYGVTGLYQSAPALTRTDNAVGLTYSINTETGAVTSDFDSVFPWNKATVEYIGDNKFLHMPDMYFRVTYDGSKRITGVAVSEQPVLLENWHKVNSFYYGCYKGSVSNGKLLSLTGVAATADTTRAQFRGYATANGDGYFQRDLYHASVMSFLWLIEFATKDSQSVVTGNVSGSVVNTGGTNSLSTPSGYNTTTGQMRWHYIEDFVGNYKEFCDGLYYRNENQAAQVTTNPAYFNDDGTNMNTLGYNNPDYDVFAGQSYILAALGWDDNNPFMCLPVTTNKVTTSGYTYNQYFCDAAGTPSATSIGLITGSQYNSSGGNNGLFYYAAYHAGANHISSRLLYKTPAEE